MLKNLTRQRFTLTVVGLVLLAGMAGCIKRCSTALDDIDTLQSQVDDIKTQLGSER